MWDSIRFEETHILWLQPPPLNVSGFESFRGFLGSQLISGVDALKKCENDAHVIIAVVAQLQIWWWVGCWFDDIPVFRFHKEKNVSIGSWKEVIMLTIPDLYYLHDSMIHIYFYLDMTIWLWCMIDVQKVGFNQIHTPILFFLWRPSSFGVMGRMPRPESGQGSQFLLCNPMERDTVDGRNLAAPEIDKML